MHRSEFLATDRGRRGRQFHRWLHRIRVDIEGVEPRSKKSMPLADRIAIQAQVIETLKRRERLAFRGPVILSLDLRTTDRNPAHIQTIAKNILDLLGQPLTGLRTRRRGLLYFDDSQIQGLVVRCEHGAEAPKIYIEALPISDLHDDLALGVYAADSIQDEYREDGQEDYSSSLELEDLARDRERILSGLGREAYLALEDMARRETQKRLLAVPRLGFRELAYLYRMTGSSEVSSPRQTLHEIARSWESLIKSNPFRILLRELPTQSGSQGAFKQHTANELQRFQNRFKASLDPLRVPVALEVVVKPPVHASTSILHDLDNVVRNYLIPEVVDIFGPPSHLAHSYSERWNKATGPWADVLDRLPKSAAVGVVRYEVWRIPRDSSDSGPGFVSAAIVADEFGFRDTLSRLDAVIDRWKESVGL